MVVACYVSDSMELPSSVTPGIANSNGNHVLNVSMSQRELLRDMNSSRRSRLRICSCAGGMASPSPKFREHVEERDETSSSVPSTNDGQGSPPLSKWKKFKEWIRNPLNMAKFLWGSVVGVFAIILLLVTMGALNGVLKTKSQRDGWIEAGGQILTALFTLNCVYRHPEAVYHLILLRRWKPKDIPILRQAYCKNGTPKPRERFHMTVVVVLLHVNFFGQYGLSAVNVGYKKSDRPNSLLGICIFFAVAGGLVSDLYARKSPLGKDNDPEMDVEAQDTSTSPRLPEKRYAFATINGKRIVVEQTPKWRGGPLDFCDDTGVARLSLFCSCCLHGWNMQRLGFGNMYVHIATFLLFIIAPFVIFSTAAIQIDSETAKEALGWTGVLVSFFGVLYGGFWRIQMRKRYNLPANYWFFGKPEVADCAQWLCCFCFCSLAQEVRTADYYEILEGQSCNDNGESAMLPLPREDGTRCNSNSAGPSTHFGNSYHSDGKLPMVDEELCINCAGMVMKPPVPSSIHR